MASPSASWSYQASPNYYEVIVVNRVHRVFSFSLEVKPLCHVLVLARQVLQPAPLYLAVFHKLVGIFIYRWLFGSSSWSQNIQIWGLRNISIIITILQKVGRGLLLTFSARVGSAHGLLPSDRVPQWDFKKKNGLPCSNGCNSETERGMWWVQ